MNLAMKKVSGGRAADEQGLLANFLRRRRQLRRLPVEFKLRPQRGCDGNASRRLRLILALSEANDPADRRWWRQLLRLTLASYRRGLCWDVRDAVALLAFQLYRHWQPRDLSLLWQARHSAGSDTYYSLDAEITFGLSAEDTLARLERRRPRRALNRAFAADLRERLGQPGASYRSRAAYLAYFIGQRLPAHRENLMAELA